MRELYIKSGKGFLLVYSVNDESSLQELLALREQVLRIKDSINVPMVLIGNKCDLIDERVLQPQDGIKISEKWGRVPFYETSAMHKTNVDEAFIDVVRQIMRNESLENQKQIQQQNGGDSGIIDGGNGNGNANTTIQQKSINSSTNGNINNNNNNKNNTNNNNNNNNNNNTSQRQKPSPKPLGKVSTSGGTGPQPKKKKKKSSCTIL